MNARVERLRERAGNYLAAGNIDAARAVCDSILAISADDSQALVTLSDCAAAQDRQRQACAFALAGARSIATVSAEHRLHLAMRLFSVGEYQAAAELILTTDFGDASFNPLLVNFSQQLRLLELHAESLVLIDAAIARGAAGPGAFFLKGNALKFLGRLDQAAIEYGACLAASPGHSGAHWALAGLGLEAGASERIGRIQKLISRGNLGPVDETYLSYALFKELDGQDDRTGAWRALDHGARLKRAQVEYNPAAEASLFDRIAETMDVDWPIDGAAGDRTPVFIIGMPRTGTTLLERILGGHPQLTNCGELNDFRMQFKWASDHYCHGFLDLAGVDRIKSVGWAELGQRYLGHTRWRVPQGSHFSDKNPGNFVMAGLIMRALPEARIIHMRRNPMDACFSNLKELFGGNAHPYSYDFADLSRHHRNYSRLMSHWRRIAPGRILDLDYEDLVSDPDGTARRVMSHCGLEYHAGQAASQANTSPVSSASSVQVRQPIHTGNVEGWKRYAAQLAPLVSLLGADGGS